MWTVHDALLRNSELVELRVRDVELPSDPSGLTFLLIHGSKPTRRVRSSGFPWRAMGGVLGRRLPPAGLLPARGPLVGGTRLPALAQLRHGRSDHQGRLHRLHQGSHGALGSGCGPLRRALLPVGRRHRSVGRGLPPPPPAPRSVDVGCFWLYVRDTVETRAQEVAVAFIRASGLAARRSAILDLKLWVDSQ